MKSKGASPKSVYIYATTDMQFNCLFFKGTIQVTNHIKRENILNDLSFFVNDIQLNQFIDHQSMMFHME